MVRHAQKKRVQNVDASPVTAASKRGRVIVIAVIALLLVGGTVAGYVLMQPQSPGFPAVEPIDGTELNPQLQEYLPQFVDAVNANPRDFERHSQLGLVYEANQFWNEASQCYQNAVTLAPNEPLPRLHLAMMQQKLGELDQAMATARELTERNSSFAFGHHRLGVIALDRNELDIAETAFREVIRLAPDRNEGYVGLADVNVRRKDYDAAKELLEKALAIRSNDSIAHHLLGMTYRGMGRESDAQRELALGSGTGFLQMIDDWSAKMTVHGTGLSRQNRRAIALMNAGRLEEAANVFESCLKYYPDNPDILNNLSTVRSRQGRAADALALLQQALAANPRHHQTYSNIASYYHERKEHDRAVEEMKKAIALAPTDASYRRKLASILGAAGRLEESRESWIAATNHEPGYAMAYARLAEVCAALNRGQEASDAIQRARELAPHDERIATIATSVLNSLSQR